MIPKEDGADNPSFTRKGVTVEGKKRLAIRDSFVKSTGPRLVRTRQHHAFRTYLLCLWCHYPKGEPRLPSHLDNKQLATLLEVGRRAANRRSSIGHVLARLESERLIRRVREGQTRRILVCHEAGGGQLYTQPKGGGPNAYIELPSGFFTNGWINELSAAAILVLLMALREERFLNHRRSLSRWKNVKFSWFQTASRLSDHYGVSKTTVEKGLRELRAIGFLTARQTKSHPKTGMRVERRNLYSNHLEIFDTPRDGE